MEGLNAVFNLSSFLGGATGAAAAAAGAAFASKICMALFNPLIHFLASLLVSRTSESLIRQKEHEIFRQTVLNEIFVVIWCLLR